MRRRSTSSRVVVLACTVALVASACTLVPPGNPGASGAFLRVVAPAPDSQAPPDGHVAISMQLHPRVAPDSLRAWITTGLPDGTTSEVTDRLDVQARHATGALTAEDLEAGLTELVAVATLSAGPFSIPVTASTMFSWEPDIAVRAGCDFLSGRDCLLPFPSDAYTVKDPASATGRRVALADDSLPANVDGVHIDPTEWNRNDGFSPGSAILAHVPGVDLEASGAPPIIDLERSLAPDSATVILDTVTGEAHLHWAELDATASSEATRALILRPGVNFEEGRRYVVALRNLVDGDGTTIPAPRGFEVYRDRIATFLPEVEERRDHMEGIFDTLAAAGIARDELHLAWDFTVSSTESLSRRMLHIRDDAFASLEGGAPSFEVTSVTDDVDDRIFRRVQGTYEVPQYLTGDGAPGSRFHYAGGVAGEIDPDAVPARNGTFTASFQCNIPRSVSDDGADPVDPARGAVYGHGLLGGNTEINAGNVRTMSDEHNMVFCATNWVGMASEDVPHIVSTIIPDLSHFPTLADRLQQAFLNTQFLGRLIRDPNGFASDPAFRFGASESPVLLPDEVYYDGNSQGGIMGGAATATSTEWTRAVLGVPGMNFSTLLRRSTQFDPFQVLLAQAYPDELDRTIGISLIQMLWDRGEANGYAHHMTDDPLPGTPEHKVLLHSAFGDFQVANVTTEVEARTIGAHVYQPALAPGRHSDVDPFFGIPPVPTDPFDGSVLVLWDSGNPAPPTANVPPRSPEFGTDPHGRPRAQPTAQLQKSLFLRPDGMFFDVCGGAPCLAP